jgi:hypothetical protein
MLSVLLSRAVWRGNADDLNLKFSCKGSSHQPPAFTGGVFVLVGSANEGAVNLPELEAQHGLN